ncbi:MAG: DUF4105 domain-containing protein [Deltaproteobacteria bacterium]|nr:DUF4105 domain-containing protein [Deltaproteobacteria bacterium]
MCRLLSYFLLIVLSEQALTESGLPGQVVSKIESLQLHNDPMWIALLHYKKKENNDFVSEADGENFFISPNGKRNPKDELIATILAFLQPEENYSDEIMHPQCRFPARYKWIKSKFSPEEIIFKDVKCERFEEWSYLLRPKGMTLVYASGYLNNPASMFGHTFIRLDRKEKTIETDLLAYAVNYAAIPTTSNAFLYAIMGLTGGFEGRFSTLPYYMKVKEYGSMEHRDLWEYHIKVNEEQIDYVVRHIWELGQTYFKYYYIDENCSYHILSLVQIAYPEIDFRDFFSVYTVPQDTIKFLLKHRDIIKGVTYRPSLRSISEHLVLSLDRHELDIALKISKSDRKLVVPHELNELSEERKAQVLDVAAVLYRLHKGYGLPEEEEKRVAEVEKEILLLRSKLNVTSKRMETNRPPSPDNSHGPAMVSLGAGISTVGSFENIELKPVLHDLISREDGYEPLTQIDMLKLSLRFNNRYEKVYVDSFDFIKIFSIAELKSWIKKLSWNIKLGTEAEYLHKTDDLKYIDFIIRGGPGIGISTKIIGRETYFLFFENKVSSDIKFNVSICSGALGGIIFKVASIADSITYYSVCQEILSSSRNKELTHSILSEIALHLSTSNDLRLRGKISNFEYYESSLSFVLFF